MSSRALVSRRAHSWKAAVATCAIVASTLLHTPEAFAQGRTQRVPQNFNIVPITVTGITVQGGQLLVNGLIGSTPFTDIPLALSTEQQAGACPILDLELGAIDLTLLGLRVQTSDICLRITAFEGGGLLGDLLCEVANLLQGGLTLPDVLQMLQTQGRLDRFLNGLTSLLNEALDVITSNQARPQATCTILDLSLGPLNLNLLGLEVNLDDCDGGPVTVTITAIPGGGLLGDLLCSLSDLLNGSGSQRAIQTLLWQISRVIAGLL